jgi:hypothetical protein
MMLQDNEIGEQSDVSQPLSRALFETTRETNVTTNTRSKSDLKDVNINEFLYLCEIGTKNGVLPRDTFDKALAGEPDSTAPKAAPKVKRKASMSKATTSTTIGPNVNLSARLSSAGRGPYSIHAPVAKSTPVAESTPVAHGNGRKSTADNPPRQQSATSTMEERAKNRAARQKELLNR